jgi:putative ABC transport system permease protein
MRTPLAWRNLVHQKVRTLIAVAGVVFAAVLILMQLGFLSSVQGTATLLYDQLDFDLLLTADEYLDLNRTRSFPELSLVRSLGVKDVESAVPVFIGPNVWRDPDDPSRRWNIMVVGIQPGDPVFGTADEAGRELNRLKPKIAQPDTVLIDKRSRPEFRSRPGPGESEATRDGREIGAERELGVMAVTLIGEYELGTGFGANGMVVTSRETFAKSYGGGEVEPNLGLVKLRPGADRKEAGDELRALLPENVRVWTRQEINEHEREYWKNATSVGKIFFMGVAVALLVGVVFVYQVMASDITNRLPEFATLKAMGYGSWYLAGVVLQQAVYLALIGYLPALLIAWGLYALTREKARLPIAMDPLTVLFVLALTVVMCSVSGVLALRKVRQADPADLF